MARLRPFYYGTKAAVPGGTKPVPVSLYTMPGVDLKFLLRRVLFSREVASYRAIFRWTFPRFFRVTVLFASSGCF